MCVELLCPGSWDGSVCMWDPISAVLLRQLYRHKGPIRSTRLSTDGTFCSRCGSAEYILAGQWLHTCSDDKTVRAVHLSSLEQRVVSDGHTASVLAMDECDGYIYSVGRDGSLLCHEAVSGHLVQQRKFDFGVRAVTVRACSV